MFDSAGDAPGEDLCMLGSARELAALPAQAIGKIRTTTGSVTVTRTGGVVVQGNVDDLVYQGDVIETAADGAVVIIFNDGTAFNLASDARMVLDEFVCDSEEASNSARLSITRGMFNFIAGKVAKTGGLSIDTPCARIRAAARGGGTGFVTLAALTFSVIQDIQAAIQDHDSIELQDTQFGIVDVFNKLTGERLTLDSPAKSLQIDPSGTVTRIALTSAQVSSLFEASVAAYGTQLAGLQAGVQLQGAATGGSGATNGGFGSNTGSLPGDGSSTPFIPPAIPIVLPTQTTSGPPPELPPVQPTPPPPPAIIITTLGLTLNAGISILNASETNTGFTINGTTSGIEDGQVVTVKLLNSSNQVVETHTATVTNNAWLLNIDPTNAKALADGTYTITADVSSAAGTAAPQASQQFTVDTTADVAPTASVTINDGDGFITDPEMTAVSYTVANVDGDATATVTFTSSAGGTPVVVSGLTNGPTTVDLSSLGDGTITATISVTDTAGNIASGTGDSSTAVPITASVAVAPASVSEDGSANLVYTVTLEHPSAFDTGELHAERHRLVGQ